MQRLAVPALELVAKSLPGVMVGAAIVVVPRDVEGLSLWVGLAVLTVVVVSVHARRVRGAGAHRGIVCACPVGAAGSAAFGVAVIGGRVNALAAARTPAGVALIGLGAAVMVAAIAGLIGGDTAVYAAVTAAAVTVSVIMAVDEASSCADTVTVLTFIACAVLAGGTGASLLITEGVLTAAALLMWGTAFTVFGIRWFTADRRMVNDSASTGRASAPDHCGWSPNSTRGTPNSHLRLACHGQV